MNITFSFTQMELNELQCFKVLKLTLMIERRRTSCNPSIQTFSNQGLNLIGYGLSGLHIYNMLISASVPCFIRLLKLTMYFPLLADSLS